MAREPWLYREVAVRSVRAADGSVRLAPLPGQAFASTMRVHAARALCDLARYPLGSCFLLQARLTDRGGEPYLYSWHGDPVQLLGAEEAARFLEAYRRLRV
ncbi:hypothetical protein [Massilia sp. TS11]|uniref:hypothetical protein n=1 Tax=Massilia sp. TS11 TaxID=2908003 RepID=UPI001EDC69DC|nr:hypothetical protein [Massilia sp. TS11]MCG2583251.1 hypothetical protein [Massilia sp. TS11]